jgi:hypothetical protein
LIGGERKFEEPELEFSGRCVEMGLETASSFKAGGGFSTKKSEIDDQCKGDKRRQRRFDGAAEV